MKIKLMTIGVAAISAAALISGCGSTTNNSNNGRSNVTNLGTNNANVGAVVVNGNANVNSNRWSNTNVTREEYDKNRAEYEREKGRSTIGSGANDSWLWFKTRAALLTTSDLRESRRASRVVSHPRPTVLAWPRQ